MPLGNNLKINRNSDYLNGNHAASNQLKDLKLHNNNNKGIVKHTSFKNIVNRGACGQG